MFSRSSPAALLPVDRGQFLSSGSPGMAKRGSRRGHRHPLHVTFHCRLDGVSRWSQQAGRYRASILCSTAARTRTGCSTSLHSNTSQDDESVRCAHASHCFHSPACAEESPSLHPSEIGHAPSACCSTVPSDGFRANSEFSYPIRVRSQSSLTRAARVGRSRG